MDCDVRLPWNESPNKPNACLLSSKTVYYNNKPSSVLFAVSFVLFFNYFSYTITSYLLSYFIFALIYFGREILFKCLRSQKARVNIFE